MGNVMVENLAVIFWVLMCALERGLEKALGSYACVLGAHELS